ncbi:MAG: hypothetical protein KatS3mg104_3072 [Phycisphaerae bacterium]|jgi:hypothetical protein|nr:MAG: hypothetical protein KatS3mg104_3072 [Phycisphaerae bacterium]
MSTLLNQLQNNEAVLLMYIANELPPADRQEIEHLLKTDDQLKAQYQTILSAYETSERLLNEADKTAIPPKAFTAARTFGDLVRQRRTSEAASVDEKIEYRRRWSLWWYPTAAAAVLAFGMFLWWKNASENPNNSITILPIWYERWQADAEDQETIAVFDTTAPDTNIEWLYEEIEAVRYLRTTDTFW